MEYDAQYYEAMTPLLLRRCPEMTPPPNFYGAAAPAAAAGIFAQQPPFLQPALVPLRSSPSRMNAFAALGGRSSANKRHAPAEQAPAKRQRSAEEWQPEPSSAFECLMES